MKINEIIQEGVWDNLKTAGQTIKRGAGTMGQGIKQGASAIGQGVKQGAGAVANYAKQNYQQTQQTQQQRFDQAAASQFQPKKWLGKEWSPQQQLRAKNIGTFAGDVASTIGQAQGGVSGQSMMAKATSTIPQKSIPIGSTLQTQLGTFKMTAQGWATETNQLVKDPKMVANLTNMYYQGSDDDDQVATPKTTTSPSGILGPGGKPIQYDTQGKPIVA